MSTSYFRLKQPVTHLKIESQNQIHTRLGVWVDHGKAGTLVVPTEALRDLLRIFAQYESDRMVPLRTFWAGPERGAVVEVNDSQIPDEATVVSEYGELLTVAEVKARDGAKRADGMPTELFGYE